MNREETNKLIADFMGMKYANQRSFSKETGWTHTIRSLDKFSTDWNWQMDVIQLIENLGFEVLIGRISCSIHKILDREHPISSLVCGDTSKKREIVYDAIVQFIQWHNNQSKS